MIGRIDSFSLHANQTAKPLLALPAAIASLSLLMSSIAVVAILSVEAAKHGLI